MTYGFVSGYKNTLYSLEKYETNRFCVFERFNKCIMIAFKFMLIEFLSLAYLPPLRNKFKNLERQLNKNEPDIECQTRQN